MTNEPIELLSVNDLREILMIGKNSAYKLLKNGQVKALRCGRHWKIPKEELANYIARGVVNPINFT